jgi:carboxylesterase type B
VGAGVTVELANLRKFEISTGAAVTSACADCTAAAAQPWHGFTAKCPGCCARAAARSPHFRRVRDNGTQDRQYRALLEQMGLSHDQVKAAAAADVEGRAEA